MAADLPLIALLDEMRKAARPTSNLTGG